MPGEIPTNFQPYRCPCEEGNVVLSTGQYRWRYKNTQLRFDIPVDYVVRRCDACKTIKWTDEDNAYLAQIFAPLVAEFYGDLFDRTVKKLQDKQQLNLREVLNALQLSFKQYNEYRTGYKKYPHRLKWIISKYTREFPQELRDPKK